MFVNGISHVNKINFKGIDNNNYNVKLPELAFDTFEKTNCTNQPADSFFSVETFNKAKELVTKSVKGDNPKESLTLIVDDDMVGLSIGDKYGVSMTEEQKEIALDSSKSAIAVHSHTPYTESGITAPVSVNDLVLLNFHAGLKRVYAITSDGRYSMFEKIGNKRPSEEDIKNYSYLIEDEIDRAMSPATAQKKATLRWNMDYYPSESARKEFEDFLESDEMYEAIVLGVHNFWKKYASELGVRYETNYFE